MRYRTIKTNKFTSKSHSFHTKWRRPPEWYLAGTRGIPIHVSNMDGGFHALPHSSALDDDGIPPSPSTPIGSPASSPAMNCSLSVPIGEPFATPPPPPPFTPWPAPSNPARPVPYPVGYDRTLHPPRPVSAFTPGQAPQVLKILISIIN